MGVEGLKHKVEHNAIDTEATERSPTNHPIINL